jgi:NAD-reducing hydrogenase small subunit
MADKPRLAMLHLAGCFGCNMSFLDLDERLLELFEVVDLDFSPFTDFAWFDKRCTIGLIEGGISNEENLRVLEGLRKNCDILVSVGACALNGNIPAMRNNLSVKACLEEAYVNGPTVYNPHRIIPSHRELPLLLDKVYPCHQVVKIDHFLPGCPPSADAIWKAVQDLLAGRGIELPYPLLKYD